MAAILSQYDVLNNQNDFVESLEDKPMERNLFMEESKNTLDPVKRNSKVGIIKDIQWVELVSCAQEILVLCYEHYAKL